MITPARRRARRTVLRRVIVARQDGRFALPVELVYDPTDPWAVTVDLTPGRATSTVWEMHRDLLAAGVGGQHTGWGDVRFSPLRSGGWAAMHLSSPDGHAVISLPVYPVTEWLTLTYDLVPPGTESDWLDLDRDIAELLRGGVR